MENIIEPKMLLGQQMYNELMEMIHSYSVENQHTPSVCIIHPSTFHLIANYCYKNNEMILPIEDFRVCGVRLIRSLDIQENKIELLGCKLQLNK
jgi:hypothetical protein